MRGLTALAQYHHLCNTVPTRARLQAPAAAAQSFGSSVAGVQQRMFTTICISVPAVLSKIRSAYSRADSSRKSLGGIDDSGGSAGSKADSSGGSTLGRGGGTDGWYDHIWRGCCSQQLTTPAPPAAATIAAASVAAHLSATVGVTTSAPDSEGAEAGGEANEEETSPEEGVSLSRHEINAIIQEDQKSQLEARLLEQIRQKMLNYFLMQHSE